MFKRLATILHPFSVIASELTIIRELYETDLAGREKPIIRITEKPRKNDTTVMYGNKEDKPDLFADDDEEFD